MQIFGKGSDNIEDSRGSSGGSGGRTILGGGIGLLVVIVGLFFGKGLTGLVSKMPDSSQNVRVVKGLPADQKVYIDLTFYDELANGFGAAGDFAQAYAISETNYRNRPQEKCTQIYLPMEHQHKEYIGLKKDTRQE